MVVLLWVSIWSARADIPPPPGYVEQCVLERYVSDDTECRTCSANFEERDRCEALEAEGYAARCRTRGASVWSEVMCRNAPAPSEEPGGPSEEGSPGQPEDERRSAVPTTEVPHASTGGCSGGRAMALVWFPLGLWWRRSTSRG